MSDKKKSVKALLEVISKESQTWEAEENFLLQLSNEEQKKYLGYVPGPNEESLEEREAIALKNLKTYQTSSLSSDAYGAPAAYDLRNVSGANYITPVKNQGSCGSCVAFGVIAAVEGTERRAKNNPNLQVDYSEGHLFYCHARSEGRRCSGDNGGWWVPPALNHFQNTGVVDEACYPYVSGDQNCSGRCSDWQNRLTKITGSTRLTNINDMKEWVSTKGPLVACYTVYNDFYAYKTGVYKRTQSATFEGGHCVCIVGYNDSQKAWICKNSWGQNWGNQGYFMIAYGEVGIDSETWGINGILDTGSLENVKVTGLWVEKSNKNAWAHIHNHGWKRISTSTDNGFLNLCSLLATAHAGKRNCRIIIDNGIIKTVYVW